MVLFQPCKRSARSAFFTKANCLILIINEYNQLDMTVSILSLTITTAAVQQMVSENDIQKATVNNRTAIARVSKREMRDWLGVISQQYSN